MKKLFFLSLILFYPLFSKIETWHVNNIPFDKLSIVKKIPLHTVYHGHRIYLKIWNKRTRNYQNGRNNFFLQAVKKGYLNDIAPIKAVIINEDNECCGYVTQICKPINPNIKKMRKYGSKACKRRKSKKTFQLLQKMRKVTNQFGVCFSDLSPDNFGLLNNQCYYIDLDGVWNFQAYKINNPNWKEALFYLNKKFR